LNYVKNFWGYADHLHGWSSGLEGSEEKACGKYAAGSRATEQRNGDGVKADVGVNRRGNSTNGR
jgi:hypothetical protein